MKLKKWKIAAAAACACFLVTAAYAATAGSSGDPLVTLSYLNGVYTGKVQSMVDDTVDQRKAELEKALADVLAGQGGSTGAAGTVFSVVTLNRGQAIVGDVGCEVMLRIGSAACGADSVGLIDTTAGSVLGGGAALTTNHLYMVTINPRTVTATSNTAKLLVRGPYTIR